MEFLESRDSQHFEAGTVQGLRQGRIDQSVASSLRVLNHDPSLVSGTATEEPKYPGQYQSKSKPENHKKEKMVHRRFLRGVLVMQS